ncbi:MAG: hypothetical protein K2M50_04860 [Treponemataceae bacterium]|nr:hypothetical protein [Treponemataceae bacterium]
MKRIFLVASIIFSSIFLFSGCYDAVIQSIRREIELEDAIISGFVNSIVRFTGTGKPAVEGNEEGKEYIFLQNGVIYYKQVSEDGDEKKDQSERRLTKNATHGRWSRAPKSPDGLKYNYYGEDYSGYYISKLAADENYVYALACRPDTDEDQSRNILFPRTVFYFPDENGGWSEIEGIRKALDKYTSTLDKDEYYLMNSSVHLFCTNTPKKEHRSAYLRIGGGSPYYDANGSSSDKYSGTANLKDNYGKKEFGNYGIIRLNGSDTNVEECILKGDQNAGYRTLGVVYLNGQEHFVDYLAVGSNETKKDEATWFCYGYGSSLYVFDDIAKDTGNGGNNSDASPCVTIGLKDTVLSLCVTKDSIVVGTYEEGAEHITIKDGFPASRTSSFFPNGEQKEGNDYYDLYKGGQLHNTSNNNAADIMCDPYIVRTLFCTDPSLGEIEVEVEEGNKGAALYSAIQFRYTESSQSADYDNVGLWAYYSSKGNWNRE